MKVLVLEVKDGTSACLREDGTVIKVHKAYPVGSSIELKEGKLLKFKEKLAELGESNAIEFIRENAQKAVMAAAVLLCICLGAGIYSYNNLIAASYMSVDVNPSLEYTLNRVNRVIDVRALNEDAESIVKELKEAGIKHSTVAETISETTRILEQDKYIAEDKDNIMLVGITGANQVKSGDINTQVHSVADVDMVNRVSVYVLETTKQERKEAQKRGVSAGRYASAKAICDKNNIDMNTMSDAEFDEISHMSVASLVEKEEADASEAEKEDENSKKEEIQENKPASGEAQAAVAKTVSSASVTKPVSVTTPPAVATAAVAGSKESTEEKEEKQNDSKSSSSSKKKKTVSNESADKSTVSGASANPAGEVKEAAVTAAASASGNTAGGSDAGTASKNSSTVATVTTDDGSVITVVVPDTSQIAAPQDTSVDEYEQTYKEIVAATVQPAVQTGEGALTTGTETTEAESKKAEETKTEQETVVVDAAEESKTMSVKSDGEAGE